MITNEITKQEIIATMTFEKCEVCIRNVLNEILKAHNNDEISLLSHIDLIEYYMDCMTVLREHNKVSSAKIDQMIKDMYY